MKRLTLIVALLILVVGLPMAFCARVNELKTRRSESAGWTQYQQFCSELDPLIGRTWALNETERFGFDELERFRTLRRDLAAAITRADEREALLFRPTGRQAMTR